VCKQFADSRDKLIGEFFENYVNRNFLLKERTKADWVPFRDGKLKAVEKHKVEIFGLEIRTATDRRSLKKLAENSDIRHMSVSDIKKEVFKGGSIVRDGFNKWFLQVTMELASKKEPIERVEGLIGIDPGLNTCMTTSDGDKFERPNVSDIRNKINSLKSKASKSKGGKVRVLTKKDEKTNRQVNVFYKPSKHILKKAKRLEERLTNKKRMWEWQVANAIVSKGKDIAIGDVDIRFLRKMYGKSVNREAIFTLWSAIESKAKDNGILSTKVNERNTTVTCSSCGEKTGPSGREGLQVRSWICSNCGAEHDRDINAAKNIAKIGQINIEIDKEKSTENKARETIREEVRSLLKKKNPAYAAMKKTMKLKDKSLGEGKREFSIEVFAEGRHSKELGEKIGSFTAIWDGRVSSLKEVL
jgi:transposase